MKSPTEPMKLVALVHSTWIPRLRAALGDSELFACGDAQTFCNELASGAVVAAFVDPGLVLPAQQSPVREAIERSEIPVVICTDLLPSTVLFLLDVVAAGASQSIVREVEDSLEDSP